MTKYHTIVDYHEIPNELTVCPPTPALVELGKTLPGVTWRPSKGLLASSATAAMAARIIQLFGNELEGTRSFMVYVEERMAALAKAHDVLNATKWKEIPVTSLQPTGEWMHQRRAFWFAHPLEAAMLDITMGGGKTKIATDLMQNWKARDTLIITPLAPMDDAWLPHLENELVCLPAVALARTQFSKLDKFVEACDALMSDDPLQYRHRILLVNHESFWREPFRSWSADQDWDLIVDDEIHREKSAGSLQSGFLHQLGSRSRRRLGLTGTLMPHSPLDVYGQYRFLDRGILGTNVAKFHDEHAIMGGWEDREIIGFRKLPELMAKIDTITIHIDDSEQGLPAVAPDIEVKVDLEPSVRRVYDKMDEEFVAAIRGGQITAANAGVKLLRLHQLACGIAKPDGQKDRRIGDAKIRGLRDFMLDFNEDEPIVVFVRFKLDMWDIANMCKKIRRAPALMGDGMNELAVWKRGKAPILVAQIQSVKEGVDLTRSSVGAFYSTGINLGDYLQCRKRLHRPPQERMVRFAHILARGTREISSFWSLKKRRDVIADARRSARTANRDGTV